MNASTSFSRLQVDSRFSWLVVAGLASLTIVLRLPFVDVPIDADEAGYLYVARHWTDSYRLYRDIPFDRPPGIFLIYRGILAALGDGVIALRLAAACWSALTSVAFFRFALDVAPSRWIAAAAAALVTVASASPAIEGFMAQSELFALLPLVLSAHAVWRERWGRAGAMAGLATVIKPIGLSGLILASAWWWYQRRWRWGLFGRLLAGYALIGTLALVHVWFIDWHGFWAQQVLKLSTMAEGPAADRLLYTVAHTSPAWLGLACLAALGLLLSSRRVAAFSVLWMASSLIGMRMGGEWWPHYVVQIVPALAWASVPALAASATSGRGRIAVVLSVIVGLLGLAWSAVPLSLAEPQEVSWAMSHAPAVAQQDEIGNYVRSITSEGETIQVAFLAPSLYVASSRRATVPRFYFYEYRKTSTAVDLIVGAVRRREPAAIVWVGPPLWMTQDEFMQIITEAGYVEGRRFGGIVVFRRSPS